MQGTFNNTIGKLSLTGAFFFYIFPPAPTTSGPGILANVTFTVVGYGSSDITLGDDTVLKSPTANIIDALANPEQIGDGYFSNTPQPPQAITATINIKPNTLNLKSKRKWIKAHIELPEGSNVGDVDVSTILLNNAIPAMSSRVSENTLMVKFNRTELTAHIYHVSGITYGNVTLTITGQLTDGTTFEGSDTIKVMFGGDADLSGLIELTDFQIWANNYGKYSGEWSSDVDPDFDSNDFVELTDFQIWVANYGATVPPPP